MGIRYSRTDLNRRYHLTCKVKIVKTPTEKLGTKGIYESESVLMIPEHNSELQFFFSQYLDSTDSENPLQFTGILAYPLSQEIRLTLHPADKRHSQGPYFFIQSVDSHEGLKACKKNKVFLEILSEQDEAAKHVASLR